MANVRSHEQVPKQVNYMGWRARCKPRAERSSASGSSWAPSHPWSSAERRSRTSRPHGGHVDENVEFQDVALTRIRSFEDWLQVLHYVPIPDLTMSCEAADKCLETVSLEDKASPFATLIRTHLELSGTVSHGFTETVACSGKRCPSQRSSTRQGPREAPESVGESLQPHDALSTFALGNELRTVSCLPAPSLNEGRCDEAGRQGSGGPKEGAHHKRTGVETEAGPEGKTECCENRSSQRCQYPRRAGARHARLWRPCSSMACRMENQIKECADVTAFASATYLDLELPSLS